MNPLSISLFLEAMRNGQWTAVFYAYTSGDLTIMVYIAVERFAGETSRDLKSHERISRSIGDLQVRSSLLSAT